MAELIRKPTGEWEVVEEKPATASEILSKVSRLSVQNKKWVLLLFRLMLLAQDATKRSICRQFGIDPNSVKLD